MNKPLLPIAAGVALACGALRAKADGPFPALTAAPPFAPPGAAPAKAEQPADKSAGAANVGTPGQAQCMLLSDGRIFEAHVLRDDTGAYIATTGTSAVRFSASQVLHVGADRQELHRFLRGRFDENDHDERMKLARWCLTSGLREEAVKEAKTILRAQATHPDALAFVAALEKSDRAARRPVGVVQNPGVMELGGDSLAQFTARVQPILSNRCGACHANARYQGDFQLARVKDRSLNSAMTAKNLRAATAFIDMRQPLASELLLKAVEAHGGRKLPPIAGPHDPVFRDLRDWVALVAKSRVESWTEGMDPALAGQFGGKDAALALEEARRGQGPNRRGRMEPGAPAGRPGFGPAAADDAPPEPAREMPRRAPAAPPGDPHDPAAFNDTRPNQRPAPAPMPPPNAAPMATASAAPKVAPVAPPPANRPGMPAPPGSDPFDPGAFNGGK